MGLAGAFFVGGIFEGKICAGALCEGAFSEGAFSEAVAGPSPEHADKIRMAIRRIKK